MWEQIVHFPYMWPDHLSGIDLYIITDISFWLLLLFMLLHLNRERIVNRTIINVMAGIIVFKNNIKVDTLYFCIYDSHNLDAIHLRAWVMFMPNLFSVYHVVDQTYRRVFVFKSSANIMYVNNALFMCRTTYSVNINHTSFKYDSYQTQFRVLKGDWRGPTAPLVFANDLFVVILPRPSLGYTLFSSRSI
jgi:hypothetical protein